TGRCNQHCRYCFYAEQMQTGPDLPTAAWLAFFGQLGSLGVRSVCLSGGEVFVRPDIWELIDAVIDNRMRYTLLTNGSLITEETVDRLSRGRYRVRLDSIQVSLDGSRAEIHDACRGAGSFEGAVRGLRLLREAGLPVTSRVTINRYNVGDLEAAAALLLDDIGLRGFGTNGVVPLGACHRQAQVTLRPREEWQAMRALVGLSRCYPDRIQATAGPLARWRGYQRMERARAEGKPEPGMGYLTACGCFTSKLAVHHDGVITPCNMLSRYEIGTIQTTPICAIWGKHPLLRELAARRSVRVDQTPGCGDCEWAPYCNGSCPALPVDRHGDLHRTSSQDCYRRFINEVGRVTELSID
ncbi:MAG: radical SAM protein, partial [Chitinivibrionales bacterium]|nr:radical SAM protein [Chitinivibrionales bacterium]